MTRVPYRNPVDALTDLSEGRIDVLMAALGIVLPRTQDGKVKVLAIVNPQRSPLLPDVPTAAEAGFTVLTYEPIGGLFAPSEMPAAVRERIAADLQAVAADPAIAARLEPSGRIVSFMPAADFAAALERERDNLAAVVADARRQTDAIAGRFSCAKSIEARLSMPAPSQSSGVRRARQLGLSTQ